MVRRLTFDVFGTPGTAGSKKAYVRGGKAVIVSDSQKVAPWRQDVVAAVRTAQPAGWEPIIGPVTVDMVFWLPRPKSAPKTRDIFPSRGLDMDKLLRSTWDAMTNSGVWVDDSQVVSCTVGKFYSVGPDLARIYKPDFHRPPGCAVTVIGDWAP